MEREELSLENVWRRVLSLEKRVSYLEYKMNKILKHLEKIEQLKKGSQILQAFLGDIEEVRLDDKVIVREGVILVKESLAEGLNEKKIEDELNCYVIHDNIEGERYVGFMPKVAIEGEVTDEAIKNRLKKWFIKYGRDLIKKFA